MCKRMLKVMDYLCRWFERVDQNKVYKIVHAEINTRNGN